MLSISYIISLLFIIIFILFLLLNTYKCPKKIKFLYNITLLIFFVRYLAVLVCALIENQKIIYFIKELAVTNFITVPLLGLVAYYIFLRDDTRKFDYNYYFLVIITLLYIALVYLFKIEINIDFTFGFIIKFKELLTPILVYLIMIASIAVLALVYIDKPYSNKSGMYTLMISLLATIVEILLFLGGYKIFPYPIFGEVCILITTYKAINTFKR